MISIDTFTPRRLKLLLVALPLVVASAYYATVAADRYESVATVALQQAGADGSAVPGAALLLAGITPPSREDTLYLRDYVHSLGLLRLLDERLGVRRHYEGGGSDFVARLWSGASQEDLLDHWRRRVDVSVDELSSTLTVRVQGFDAAFAQTLGRAILDECEKFVNEASHKLAREKLAFSEGELERAGERLQAAKAELLAFQTKNRLLDPTVQAQASGALVAELQAGLARSEAELRGLRTFLNDDAYQVRALQAQIAATRAQLDAERGRSIGQGRQAERLNALAADFQGLQMKAEFALDAYKLALASVENARIEATRKIKSLVVIEPPTLPETAEYPRRLYNLATLFVACLLLYAVVRLVIATIREHQD